MKSVWVFVSIFLVIFPLTSHATVVGSIRGIVHDPDHRPMQGASVVVKSTTSGYSQTTLTSAEGAFEVTSIPVGRTKSRSRAMVSPPRHRKLSLDQVVARSSTFNS